MRIVVMGTGGTGGYFGAKLAQAGEEVTFVARGAHLEALRRQGIRIRSAVEGEWSAKVSAVESLAGHPPADLVLFCVKSFDTETAAEAIRPVVGPGTGILSLQNGVDNEEKLARLLGPEHVLGGVCYVFSNIEAPGVIVHHQLGRIVLGALDGKAQQQADAFAAACRRASIPVETVPNVRKAIWEKYVFLAPLAGTTALTRLPVRYIQQSPPVRELWRRQLEELLAIAKADKAGLDADMMQRCAGMIDSFAPTNYSSLYQDLVQGKRLELEALQGHAVKLGERHGIPTPTLFAVYAALWPYVDGRPA